MPNENGAQWFTATLPESRRSIRVGRVAADNLTKLLPIKKTHHGGVEGRLETISVHRTKRFIIYHATTQKGITCKIERDELLDQAKLALGGRVFVRGQVSINERNEPVSIGVEYLRVLRADADIPRATALTGTDPDFTGDMTTAEYLRSIRSEETEDE